jgi:hypothetical protein
MKVEGGAPKPLQINNILHSWESRSVYVNHEYQRGIAWDLVQQQRLVDSVLRGYILPLFYFQKSVAADFEGNTTARLEVIDGQQRLLALSKYHTDKWPALKASDPKLALPDAVRAQPCPWGGQLFSELTGDLQERFLKTDIMAVLVTEASRDEIRDLFIRLQAGTALTRQQVRDAWPGNIGPYIERLAGKVDKHPKYKAFRAIDKRGTRPPDENADEVDPYHDDRQTCAQLLWLFHRRRQSPSEVPALQARALDELYHTLTAFDSNGPEAQDFERVLGWCDKVLSHGWQLPYKPKKNELFSLFLMLSDLMAVSSVSVDSELPKIKAAFVARSMDGEPTGKVSSAAKIVAHYEWFVGSSLKNLNIAGLDSNRLFSEDQKREIWAKAVQNGQAACQVCGQPVTPDGVEYDHIIPWIRGGRTVPENGRVVHVACHARGRPVASFRTIFPTASR